jgi:hypothetical protein
MNSCFLLAHEERHEFQDYNGWIPLAHSYPELQERVLYNIRNYSTSTARAFQDRGLNNLEQQVNEPSFDDEGLLSDYFEIFNELFFFSALTPARSRFGMIKTWQNDWEGGIEGYTNDIRHCGCYRYEIEAPIYIMESETPNDEERMLGYIGTLLHEMLHSFIQNYACACDICGEEFKSCEGQTGHGCTWQSIAYAVESFVCTCLVSQLILGEQIQWPRRSM